MSIEDHLRTPNIHDSSRNLSEYLCGGLTRPRGITFSIVNSISSTCMLSKLYFQDFYVVFSRVKSLGRPFNSLGLYKTPIVTLEHTIKLIPLFESLAFSTLQCSPYLRVLYAYGFKYNPLWIQGLKRLVLWIQTLTLLEQQGLWIQATVLHCTYAKAMSSGIRVRLTFQYQYSKWQHASFILFIKLYLLVLLEIMTDMIGMKVY